MSSFGTVPDLYNLPEGLNGLGSDMYLSIIEHMDSLQSISAFLLVSQRIKSIINCKEIKKFFAVPDISVICSGIWGSSSPFTENHISLIRSHFIPSGESIFLLYSTRRPTNIDILPRQYMEILLRNNIVADVLSMLKDPPKGEFTILFKGILKLFQYFTGANLFQTRKTTREMGELFMNSIMATSDLIQEYLIALLHRWMNGNSVSRDDLPHLSLYHPSLHCLQESIPPDDTDAVKVSERQQKVLSGLIGLLDAGYTLKEGEQTELEAILTRLVKKTKQRRKEQNQTDMNNWKMYYTLYATERRAEEVKRIVKEGAADSREMSVLEKEDDVREIRAMKHLCFLPIYIADPTRVRRQGNLLIHHGVGRYSSLLLGCELKNGIHRLFKTTSFFTYIIRLLFQYTQDQPLKVCGVVDSSLRYPPPTYTLSGSRRGVGWNIFGVLCLQLFLSLLPFSTGTLHNRKNSLVASVPCRPTTDSIITMEVCLQSEEREKRTLHFFCDGSDIGGFFFGLPSAVRFGVTLSDANDCVEFISLEICSSVLSLDSSEVKGYGFDGGVK